MSKIKFPSVFSVGAAVILYAGLFVLGYFLGQKGVSFNSPLDEPPVACTTEAKICPDGSAVGRTGPNCEFDACPSGVTDVTKKETLTPKQKEQQLVESYFPQSLIDDYYANIQGNGTKLVRTVAYATADLAGSGHADFVVAAYTNGFAAAVRVFRRQGNNLVVVDDPKFPTTGVIPYVEALNIDGLSGDEIIVTLGAATVNVSNWVFRWDGTSLRSVGPVELDTNGTEWSMLVNADWCDSDGDGKMEIFAPYLISPFRGDATEQQKYDVYRWNGHLFVASGTVARIDCR